MSFGFKLGLLFLCLVYLECLPVGNNYQRQIPTDDALNFMKKYGYLVSDNGQSEAIYSEENLSNIIKTMQRFGAIEETGVIDNETVKLMASPRCGVPDIIPNMNSRRRKRYATISGWNKRHLTYYISNWSPKLGEHVVASNIQKALDIWGGYGRLKFTRSQTSEADIIVAFGRGYHGDRYPFDGPGGVLAHGFFPSESDRADSGGDIHFDDEEEWIEGGSPYKESSSGYQSTDFFTVALHELGHSLGLAHSDVPTSVMFPYYQGWDENSKNSLDYDDILGMYSLYIQRRLKEDDTTPAYYPQDITTVKSYGSREDEPESSTLRHDREETTTSGRRRNPWFGNRHYPQTTLYPPTPTTRYQDHTILYEGDDESVEVHKNHDPHHKPGKNHSPSLPYICQGHFDAVATLRGELFIFKDQYLWRLSDKGAIVPGYPILIRSMFQQLPKSVKKIDAAYQRPDGNIVLFSGNNLWIYNGHDFVENSPRPLSYYDLPEYLDGIDAAQNWAKNGKTYFYKNDRFWRYDEKSKTMDPGYPMHMERWRGVPTNLDAAMTWKDGNTYFFKGELFWKFDNTWIMATKTSPLPIAPIWLGCNEETLTMLTMKRLFGL